MKTRVGCEKNSLMCFRLIEDGPISFCFAVAITRLAVSGNSKAINSATGLRKSHSRRGDVSHPRRHPEPGLHGGRVVRTHSRPRWSCSPSKRGARNAMAMQHGTCWNAQPPTRRSAITGGTQTTLPSWKRCAETIPERRVSGAGLGTNNIQALALPQLARGARKMGGFLTFSAGARWLKRDRESRHCPSRCTGPHMTGRFQAS